MDGNKEVAVTKNGQEFVDYVKLMAYPALAAMKHSACSGMMLIFGTANFSSADK